MRQCGCKTVIVLAVGSCAIHYPNNSPAKSCSNCVGVIIGAGITSLGLIAFVQFAPMRRPTSTSCWYGIRLLAMRCKWDHPLTDSGLGIWLRLAGISSREYVLGSYTYISSLIPRTTRSLIFLLVTRSSPNTVDSFSSLGVALCREVG